jgi:hypothetical protein
MPFTRIALAVAVGVSVSALAAGREEGAEPSAQGDLREEEDRADRLPPAQQVERYDQMRASLQARDDPRSQAALGRLIEKLSLARLMVANPNANFATRLAFCKKAAAIGDDYLRRGDARRALFWATKCRDIEPRNEYSSVLRNRINDHLRSKLDRALTEEDWSGARQALSRWRELMGDEPAAARGVSAYAAARSRRLINRLAAGEVEAVMAELVTERERMPDAGPWADVRGAVSSSLQGPFDRAVAERRIPEGRVALEAQRDVVKRFGVESLDLPSDDNAQRLEELVEALAPSPLERPYGVVRGVRFRLEAGSLNGEFDFESRGVRIVDSTLAPAVAVTYRTSGMGRRFVGGDIDFAAIETSAGVSSNSVTLAHVDVVLGARGDRLSAWALVGALHGSFRFAGTSSTDDGGGLVFGSIGGGVEFALSDTLSAFADARIASSDGLKLARGRAGVRYFANPNFGLDVHIRAAEMEASDASSGSRISGAYLTAGAAAVIQF